MNSDIPTETELQNAIAHATELAISLLFEEHPEDYYYIALITNGDASSPVLSAWSKQALARICNSIGDSKAEYFLKWSYAESPYFCYGESYFNEVHNMFIKRPNIHLLNNTQRKIEYELRLNAMEHALHTLDLKGLFETNGSRNNIYINVEVMPPDHSNTERAIRLNPPNAITEWLAACAE